MSRPAARLALRASSIATVSRASRPAALTVARRFAHGGQGSSQSAFKPAAGFALGAAAVAAFGVATVFSESKAGDYEAVKKDIIDTLDDSDWDDGSWGPVLVRLAWHASGTYEKKSKTGGSDGATMRYAPESTDGANAGLDKARAKLEAVKAKHPWISYADLWTLAGATAIEAMGGPKINWKPGRTDLPAPAPGVASAKIPPNGRLPDASKGPGVNGVDHLRFIFHKMGLDDRDIVALSGAHALGRCHPDRSGFDGPWTHSPITFSNLYYVELLENFWIEKKLPNGVLQYRDPDDTIMMLPSDLALLADPVFKKWVVAYARDEKLFFEDFSKSFGKLLELGVTRGQASSGGLSSIPIIGPLIKALGG
ncbi:heme peroxidase [Gonapodya prolifera JEL478]|uniref:Peroxidase n=1 Tax=Gonapodya prolifera (strain JEL478) TaxID=1344416 RepID=A0A139AQV9_GONPJ|nr:heme peroxidase [Gonapodya prolifera JEL478]|eukprot:KXS19130.1 heme peroxidase [Gonapodya prolifera JEL478]